MLRLNFPKKHNFQVLAIQRDGRLLVANQMEELSRLTTGRARRALLRLEG